MISVTAVAPRPLWHDIYIKSVLFIIEVMVLLQLRQYTQFSTLQC